ncbi:hypothetical protein [Nitrososphaeria virus YSH_462411]|uniref:Uncharacterized protein n=1 Tax=Nitrososphaeria virus YSH_462411 TaxID=3071321 RepID=A0A976UAH3_9CAUD|nr:hypothetical protein QKV92_gp38 [Yangshan Harbor Nitrososphaeria virus]UVF62310.1 hypothetical protein [Nitrososphaeria virus YSH_462411]
MWGKELNLDEISLAIIERIEEDLDILEGLLNSG